MTWAEQNIDLRRRRDEMDATKHRQAEEARRQHRSEGAGVGLNFERLFVVDGAGVAQSHFRLAAS